MNGRRSTVYVDLEARDARFQSVVFEVLHEAVYFVVFMTIDNNNNIHICIAPYGRNFRGAACREMHVDYIIVAF